MTERHDAYWAEIDEHLWTSHALAMGADECRMAIGHIVADNPSMTPHDVVRRIEKDYRLSDGRAIVMRVDDEDDSITWWCVEDVPTGALATGNWWVIADRADAREYLRRWAQASRGRRNRASVLAYRLRRLLARALVRVHLPRRSDEEGEA